MTAVIIEITPIDNNRSVSHSFRMNIPVVILARKYMPRSLSSDAGRYAVDEAGALFA
jgi:hypothetical protein